MRPLTCCCVVCPVDVPGWHRVPARVSRCERLRISYEQTSLPSSMRPHVMVAMRVCWCAYVQCSADAVDVGPTQSCRPARLLACRLSPSACVPALVPNFQGAAPSPFRPGRYFAHTGRHNRKQEDDTALWHSRHPLHPLSLRCWQHPAADGLLWPPPSRLRQLPAPARARAARVWPQPHHRLHRIAAHHNHRIR